MPQMKVLRTDDWTGGLNLRSDPFHLADNESPDLLNVDIDPRGGVSMRGAMQRLNTTAIGAIGAGAFTPKVMVAWDIATPQLLVAANAKVFYGTGANFTDTTIATTAGHGASFASWVGGSLFMYVAVGRGSAQMAKWSGAAKTLLTASATGAWQESLLTPNGTHMPKSDHAATHVDRMWVASTNENTVDFVNRVRYSHPLFPESWRSADYIDIVEGGDGITALVPFGGALLVFKKHSVHAIYGYDTDTFQVVTLSSELGTPSPMLVAVSESILYVFDYPQGLFSFDGNGFTDLFTHLRPLTDERTINGAAIMNAYLSIVGSRVWLSLPEVAATTPSATYVMDPSLGGSDGAAWTKYQLSDGKGVACGCNFVPSSGERRPVVLHPIEPYCLKADILTSYQDDIAGTPANFTSYFFTKWVDAGVISQRKMWRRPDYVVAQPTVETILTVNVFRDWDEAVIRRTQLLTLAASGTGLLWQATAGEPDANPGWGQANWGAAAEGSVLKRGSSLGLARSIMLKISGPGGKPWGVESISYKYTPRKVR